MKSRIKKRHNVIQIILLLLLLTPWIFVLINYLQIRQIYADIQNYDIINATISGIKLGGNQADRAIINYLYNGTEITTEVFCGINDYSSNSMEIAIDKRNGDVFRMNVVISYNYMAGTFAMCCLLLIEHLRYREERKKLWMRRMEEEKNSI